MSEIAKQDVYEQVGVAMTCRSYREYVDMFQLTKERLETGAILDVAAGASSFVAEARDRGFPAVAVDPLYQMGKNEMLERGRLSEVLEVTEQQGHEVKIVPTTFRFMDGATHFLQITK